MRDSSSGGEKRLGLVEGTTVRGHRRRLSGIAITLLGIELRIESEALLGERRSASLRRSACRVRTATTAAR